jgi:hypothetical protein
MTATFNHKSLIKSRKTRKHIKQAALYTEGGALFLAGLGLTAYGIAAIDKNDGVDTEDPGDSVGYLCTGGGVIFAAIFVAIDMFLANMVHQLIYRKKYSLP